MSSVLTEIAPNPHTCAHESIEDLGRDGDAAFYRCGACGSIIIARHGHRWIIRPTDASGPLPF